MYHLLLAVIYMSFISLGLPDSLLGSAWPTIYPEFHVPVSYAGVIYMIISGGTIISSLQSDRLTRKFGTGKVTLCSVLLTALALFGFSISSSYWMLVVFAIPYGFGAGGVDASINNYAALHYESRHMSWLHCMWGVGASVGPYIMSLALTGGQSWRMGYRYISIIQLALTFVIFLSLPLWKERTTSVSTSEKESTPDKPLTLVEIFKIPGIKQILLMFFCYCALEQTAGLWASSYMVLKHGLDTETAAKYGSMFFIGITIGRAISGFITMKLNDHQMIRLGQVIVLVGVILMILPFRYEIALIGLIVIGLGCAPIYPCVIHSTPETFGEEKSQAIIGVQMACAYTGNITMAPLFGIIANHISAGLLPFYLLIILVLMLIMHEKLLKVVKTK